MIHGPAFGGAHNQARVLDGPLRAHGIETVVALPEEAHDAADRLRAAGTETVRVPLHRLRATPDPRTQLRFLATALPDVRRLERLIAEHGIDIVQSHGATNPHGAIAARRSGAASVWQLFDTRAPMALRRAVMPGVVRLADAMTTWGVELARVHPGAQRLGERLIVVFPPVEQDRFEPDAGRRAVARRELRVEPNQVLIGSIGVLNPQKGHEYTVNAASRIHETHPDARFRILGGSSPAHAGYEADLRAEIDRRGLTDVVSVVDPGPDVDRLIQAFDLLLMTSVPRSEGMPTVILEAMTCEKAVVATDVGAVRELVADGVTGTIVPPLDTDAIVAALRDLVDDGERRAAFAENGRTRAARAFNLERLADLHAQAYSIAIEHRARQR